MLGYMLGAGCLLTAPLGFHIVLPMISVRSGRVDPTLLFRLAVVATCLGEMAVYYDTAEKTIPFTCPKKAILKVLRVPCTASS